MSVAVSLKASPVLESPCDVLAIGVLESSFEKQKGLAAVHAALSGQLFEHAERAKFEGKSGQVLDVPTLGQIGAQRVVLVGLGKARKPDEPALRSLAAIAARHSLGAASLALQLPERVSGAPAMRAVGEGLGMGRYRFTKYLTGKRRPEVELARIDVHAAGRVAAGESRALTLGIEVADAVAVARDAVNEPPNELTPEGLASIARQIAKKGRLKVKVLDKKGILGANMLLHHAVGRGSRNEPRFIHLSYVPKRPKAKLVFVGKGLTFDSGGLCIKPAAGMGDMKSDMGGAAAVLGLMQGVAVVRPNVEVHVIVGAAENMPDGDAYRPGDVFGSLDGKTVEIINTDAEGRLVLADALAYARKLEPDLLVDAATLTGACLVALGKACSAFYADDNRTAKKFEGAAQRAGESFWRMPLLHDMRSQLESDVADLKHTGERWGGSITAALFLREFVGDCNWIHCDVAGPVLADRARGTYPKGGTGHPVLTFLSLVESFA